MILLQCQEVQNYPNLFFANYVPFEFLFFTSSFLTGIFKTNKNIIPKNIINSIIYSIICFSIRCPQDVIAASLYPKSDL